MDAPQGKFEWFGVGGIGCLVLLLVVVLAAVVLG